MDKKKRSLIIIVLVVGIAVVVCLAILSATKVVNFKEVIKPNKEHVDSTVDTKIIEILKGNWASFSGYDEESYSCIGDGYSIFTAGNNLIMAGKFHTMVSRNIKSIDVLSENRYKINLEPMDDYSDVYIFDTSEINNGILKVPYSETDMENFYIYKLVNKADVSKDTIFNNFCNWYIKNENVDTFTNEGNGYGKVNVTGYAYTEERTNSDTGEKYKYVFFKVTESNSNNFMQFLEDNNGNAYVGDKAIGLGCLNNNIISYNNASDEFGTKGVNYKLSVNDTSKIMSSSSNNPINLELEKYRLTNGSSGYNCTSLITKITVK